VPASRRAHYEHRHDDAREPPSTPHRSSAKRPRGHGLPAEPAECTAPKAMTFGERGERRLARDQVFGLTGSRVVS
jgi:hypothetical protein